MHVDTVGDAVVDTLYSGYGRTIFLPGIFRYLAGIVSFHLHLFARRSAVPDANYYIERCSGMDTEHGPEGIE